MQKTMKESVLESIADFAKTVSIKQWPKVLRMLGMLEQQPRRILLHGKPGTGKTTYALSLSPESERITLTQGQFPDALLGKFLLRDGSTFWADAPATRAAKRGLPLVIDEIHMGGAELDSTLQAILDDVSVCRLNLDNGEVIEPQEGYRVIATMNGSPDQLRQAVLDRFDMVLRCDTPHDGILRRLSPESAAYISNKYANEPDPDQWVPEQSARRFLAWESLRKQGVPDALAADLVFGEGQGVAVINGVIDAARNMTLKAGK
jgi:AAA+ superfamily predicted ATPase